MDTHQIAKQDGKQFSVCQIVKSAEENSQELIKLLGVLTANIEQARPMVEQLFHDFANLKKGQTIGGCATQEEWSRKYFHKTARALRYTISGGNANNMRSRRALNRLEGPDRKMEMASVPTHGPSIPLSPDSTIVATNVLNTNPKTEMPLRAPVSVLPDESQLQKLRADLVSQRALVEDLKRLVKLILGDEANLWHLSDETRRLYNQLMP